jgi:hypothetical protein
MHENYCFKCGCYTWIDEHSKLCSACYEAWRAGGGARAATRPVRLPTAPVDKDVGMWRGRWRPCGKALWTTVGGLWKLWV